MVCSGCGAMMAPHAAFCGQCGAAQPRKAGISYNRMIGVGLLVAGVTVAAIFGGYWLGRQDSASPDTAGLGPTDSITPIPGKSTGETGRSMVDGPVASPPVQAPIPAPVRAPAFLDSSVTLGEWKFYVILGSAPQGSGNAATRAAQLNRCLGYQPATDFTYAFEGLAPDLEFVHLGGYSTMSQANRVVAWARGCVPDAYVKRAKFLFD